MVKNMGQTAVYGIYLSVLYLPIIVFWLYCLLTNPRPELPGVDLLFNGNANLFDNSRIMDAFTTTLTLAFGSALAATIIGVVGAIGISAMRKAKLLYHAGSYQYPDVKCRDCYCIVSDTVIYPFYQIGIYHCIYRACDITVFRYVILNVLPRLRTLNKNAYEAALDLGATPLYAFFKVCWPELMPGIMSGFLMAATMSMDDFVITYFTRGPGINTISTMVYSEVKRGIQPEMYALSRSCFC